MITYREIFFAYNGIGPFECSVCSEVITPLENEDWAIHHRDGNRANRDPSNLENIHKSCHASRHAKGVKRGKNYGMTISAMLKERWKNPEYKLRVLPKVIAGSHTPEASKKRSDSMIRAHAEGRHPGWKGQ